MLFQSSKKGFTILEMLVVIAIITMMTGVLLSNLPSFRDSTTLQLVAQDVAVTIRQAQVFGIGTRVISGADRFPGHGIYFCNPTDHDSCKKNFLLFADKESSPSQAPDYHFFNNTEGFPVAVEYLAETCKKGDECRDVYSLGGNIELHKILIDGVVQNGGLSIAFSRLYPDAFIRDDTKPDPASKAELYLKSTRDKKCKIITVYNTGGITVSTPDAADTLCN